MLDFIDLKTVFVIFHLLGVVVGAGAAFMTDIMFMYSTKDRWLTRKEVDFISLGSFVVWTGIFLIIASGVGLFMLDPERLMASTKFQAKMTIVLILVINGIIFHAFHLPFLKRHLEEKISTSEDFIKRSKGLFISGSVSVVSWLSAIILGVFSSIPYPYWLAMSFYLAVLLVATTFSIFVVRKRFLKDA